MSLQGSFETIALPDVMALLASSNKSGELRVVGGQVEGRLWLKDGCLVGSSVGRAHGYVDAMFELLRLTEGNFVFKDGADAPAPDEAAPVEPVVTAAQERLQEWREIETVVPSLEHRVRLVSELPAPQVTLSAADWPLVTAVALAGTVRGVVEELARGYFEACQGIKKLVDSGLVVVDPPRVRPAGTDPARLARRAAATNGSPTPDSPVDGASVASNASAATNASVAPGGGLFLPAEGSAPAARLRHALSEAMPAPVQVRSDASGGLLAPSQHDEPGDLAVVRHLFLGRAEDAPQPATPTFDWEAWKQAAAASDSGLVVVNPDPTEPEPVRPASSAPVAPLAAAPILLRAVPEPTPSAPIRAAAPAAPAVAVAPVAPAAPAAPAAGSAAGSAAPAPVPAPVPALAPAAAAPVVLVPAPAAPTAAPAAPAHAAHTAPAGVVVPARSAAATPRQASPVASLTAAPGGAAAGSAVEGHVRDSENDTINRGLLLKFLSSVRS